MCGVFERCRERGRVALYGYLLVSGLAVLGIEVMKIDVGFVLRSLY